MTKNVSVSTSRQVADRLLCGRCEERLNKNGERYVLNQVCNNATFPLLDKLRLAVPLYQTDRFAAFSGRAVAIDTRKLAHFALGVLWKASVKAWDLPYGGTTSIKLRNYEEPIRKFLIGEIAFPADVVVVATACTDFASQGTCWPPARVPTAHCATFSLLTRGIYFRVQAGTALSPDIRRICCANGPEQLVFVADCEEKTLQAFAHLFRTSKPAAGLSRDA